MADTSESLDDAVTASIESQSRKRTSRVQLACDPCRAAKVKCDRTLPICEQCYKRSREATCKYKDNGLRYIMATQNRSTMKEKMERLEQLVTQLQGALPTPDAMTEDRSPGWSTGLPTNMLAYLQSGRLEVSRDGRTQWTGLSHWQSLMHDIADVKDYIGCTESVFDIADDFNNTYDQSLPDADILMGTPHLFSIPDLLNMLPAKPEMDRYVSTWFSTPEPIRVVVHALEFQQEYSKFWTDTAGVGPAWLALLLIMACLGAELLSQVQGDALATAQADMLRRLAAHALIRADTTIHQPYLIEALILYVTAQLFRDHDVSPKTWQILGLIIRLCYHAGYHRDPSRSSMFSPYDCEMRRRVWTVAQELEISISCCIGTISFVNRRLSDTRLPTNYLDSDFSPTHLLQARSKEDYTLVQVEVSFFSIVEVLGDVAMAAHCREPPSSAEIANLSQRLDEAHDSLPQRLRMMPIGASIVDNPAEIADRTRIELAYRRAVCLLYHRSLGQVSQQRESTKCENAAICMVQTTIDMLQALQPGGRLAPLKLLIVRHIHDFTFAAMLLCAVLKRNATRDPVLRWDSPKCRTVESQLLQACQLWDMPGVPSPKARIALGTITSFLNSPRSIGLYTISEPQREHDGVQADTVGLSTGPDLFSQTASFEANPLAFELSSNGYGDWLVDDRGGFS